MTEPDAADRRRPAWAAAFAVFSVPAALAAAETYLNLRLEGHAVAWWYPAATQAPAWYVWALATPFVLATGRRFPLERGGWRRGLPVHLALAAAASAAHAVVYAGSRFLVATSPAPMSFGGYVLRSWLGWSIVDLILYAAILAAGAALDFYRRMRERELHAARLETQLAQAQIQALRMQLNPHFLFNTLNTTAMLVREADNDAAVRMLARLSDLLRHVLDEVGAQEVPLRQELELIERYLEIEQVRFQDRLRIRVDVEPGLLDAPVPNLILQPIVENAVRHGVARRSAAGVLRIRAERDGASLVLTVKDDGPGLPPGWSPGAARGVGLRNTRARLAHLYGDDQRLEAFNAEGGGAVVRVRMPLRAPLAAAPPEEVPA